jgi:hypothetical protein
MHFKFVLLSSALLVFLGEAALSEPCIGANNAEGVCVTVSSCNTAGGITVNGRCPSDPANVKCCTKPSCKNSSKGNCRWKSDCAGSVVANQCPGPTQFQCCSASGTGFGGYGKPNTLTVGVCKKVAVNGANLIIKAFPGRVRELGCIRDCQCINKYDRDDHCCGKAIDLMCSDAGGVPTMSGLEIAEWVMKNQKALNLKYVIWGQKIWNPTIDKTSKSWLSWRNMDNRGSVTENHWDHVHVSFN